LLPKKNFVVDVHNPPHPARWGVFGFKNSKFAKTDTERLSFISSYFHGNIRARLGRIITATDVERKRKEVIGYVF